MLQPKKISHAATIVLAGGQGTRLFPLTQHRCKPDIAFGGKYRLVNIPISNSIHSGVEQIFVISQYFSSQLNTHISQTFPSHPLHASSIHFIYPEEKHAGRQWYEGTADAIRKNIDLFSACPVDYFIILSGDQLYSMDLSRMLETIERAEAEMVVAAMPVCGGDAKRMGLLRIDRHHAITNFYEKPQDPAILNQFVYDHDAASGARYLASMGIYIFKKDVLLGLLSSTQGNDFGKDLIPHQILHGQRNLCFLHEGYWEDIGTVKSFYEANLSLTQGQLALDLYDEAKPIYAQPHHFPAARFERATVEKSVICEGSLIDESHVIDSLIGPRVRIGKNCRIERCVILGNPVSDKLQPWPLSSYTIGDHSTLEGVIVDEYAKIGKNVTLINRSGCECYDGEGIYVRDKIIIVPANTQLPDGYIFEA